MISRNSKPLPLVPIHSKKHSWSSIIFKTLVNVSMTEKSHIAKKFLAIATGANFTPVRSYH